MHIWNGDLSSLDFEMFSRLPNLSHIDFHDCIFLNMSEIQKLSKCQKLICLYVNHAKLNKSDLEPLTSCPIEILCLDSDEITDDELYFISSSFFNLEWLSLYDNIAITDIGLLSLCKIKKLQVLDVRRTNVTKTGIEEFKKSRPDVKIRCNFLNEVDINE
jgi:hypothetical protein